MAGGSMLAGPRSRHYVPKGAKDGAGVANDFLLTPDTGRSHARHPVQGEIGLICFPDTRLRDEREAIARIRSQVMHLRGEQEEAAASPPTRTFSLLTSSPPALLFGRSTDIGQSTERDRIGQRAPRRPRRTR
jgi:hypothetical protein